MCGGGDDEAAEGDSEELVGMEKVGGWADGERGGFCSAQVSVRPPDPWLPVTQCVCQGVALDLHSHAACVCVGGCFYSVEARLHVRRRSSRVVQCPSVLSCVNTERRACLIW